MSSIWQSPSGGSILPFDPNEAILALRSERYLALRRTRTTSLSFARHVYYRLRPLLPRRLQIAFRRGFVRVQEGTSFPRWPTETALYDLADLLLGSSLAPPDSLFRRSPRGRMATTGRWC